MDFFEKIGRRLSDAGQNVAQQTRDFSDVTKLNSAISDREKRISQMFLQLGQSYYERHKSDEQAEELDIIEQINALYSEISVNQEKIRQIKNVVKCEKCGADLPPKASFCNVCGVKVNQAPPVSTNVETGRVCPVCHAVIGADNLFCVHCGAKLGNTEE